MIVGWQAWFTDCCELVSYKSDAVQWNELPADGCLGIVLWEDSKKPDGTHLRSVWSGYDYYFKADGEVYGCDVDSRNRDTTADIVARYDNPHILRGKWASIDMFQQAQNEMQEAEWL